MRVLVDGAQVAGWCDINLMVLGVDLFAFAGHKALQSPPGVGGLYIAPGVLMECPKAARNISSGTSKHSLPSFCDAGSMNIQALAGLAAGCRWLSAPPQTDRLARTRRIAEAFSGQIKNVPRVTVYHDASLSQKVPTVAFTLKSISSQELQHKLRKCIITASSGFQCAPRAHEALGTNAEGVTRISFGACNDPNSIERLCQAVFG